jgi:hypothetical protein
MGRASCTMGTGTIAAVAAVFSELIRGQTGFNCLCAGHQAFSIPIGPAMQAMAGPVHQMRKADEAMSLAATPDAFSSAGAACRNR